MHDSCTVRLKIKMHQELSIAEGDFVHNTVTKQYNTEYVFYRLE